MKGFLGSKKKRVWISLLFLFCFVKVSVSADASFGAFAQQATSEKNQTRSLLIWKDDELILEWHKRPEFEKQPALLWSMTKSLTNYLLFAATQKHGLKIDQSICETLEDVPERHCEVTPRHLLSFSSGIAWKESYEEEPYDSSVVAMLYLAGAADMARFVLDHPREYPPGSVFRYSSGDTVLLGKVIRAMVGEENWSQFLSASLERFGLQDSFSLEADAALTPVASSYLYMSPRDFLRFGVGILKMITEGTAEEKQWMEFSLSRPEFTLKPGPHLEKKNSPAHSWWLNRKNAYGRHPWPALPADAFAALGHWGQKLFIIPSENVVILRVGDERKDGFDFHAAMEALPFEKRAGPGEEKNTEHSNEFKESPSSVQMPSYTKGLKFFEKLRIGAAFQAKLYCSCRFVQKANAKDCSAYVESEMLPQWLMPISEGPSEVSVGVWPYRRTAGFVAEGPHCALAAR